MSKTPDQHWMDRACTLARKGLFSTTPNPRVGCVLVSRDGQPVGEGYHAKAGGSHAEVVALREAGDKARGCTAYVTLEPCNHVGRTGACTEALIAAQVAEVVYGMQDPNPLVAGEGIARLRQAGIRVRGPVLEASAQALNPGFIKRMANKGPFVRCKLAMSLDGRTAMASGESQWITGPEARHDVQLWRAQSCAIVTGIGTVLHDDPALTVRDPSFGPEPRQPKRVVVDSHMRMPEDARLLSEPGTTVVATCSLSRPPLLSAAIWGLPGKDGRVDLQVLMARLADAQCNEVFIEAGPGLAGAFLQAGLIDELIVYMAPKIMGSDARPLFQLSLPAMKDSLALAVTSVTPIGNDWRIIATPERSAMEQEDAQPGARDHTLDERR